MGASTLLSAGPRSSSLKRSEDYVVFTGARMPSMIGSETGDLHLYACGPSGAGAIPFQVDKRDADGRLIFPDEAGRDPLRDGTLLDENDELVFMARDAGDKCPENGPPGGAVRGVEIELEDPLDGGLAWAYLLERPGSAAPQIKDYVSRREDADRVLIRGEQYEVGQPHGKQYYDWLRLRLPDGSWGEDLFDRQKMGMKALLLNGSIPLNIPEQGIVPRTLGTIDGPVRVVMKEMRMVEIKLIGFKYVTEFCNYFYGNGYVSPLDVDVPVTLRKVFLDISFYYGMDFSDAALGSVFRNPSNPKGIVLDGKPDPGIDEGDNLYMTLSGPQGSFIEVFILDDQLDQMVERATYVEEDPETTDPDDEYPGRLIAGFHTKSATNLKKGRYQYTIYHYYPGSASEEKVGELLDMIDHPLQVRSRPLQLPAASSDGS